MHKTNTNFSQVEWDKNTRKSPNLRSKQLDIHHSLEFELRSNYDLDLIVGHHPSMVNVLKSICQIANTEATVLIQGETGTGKEVVAKSLHLNSDRRDEPFVPVNCAAIPENLMESELFGHLRGAFTGAVSEKKGWFEIADKGTIFLDEVSEMPFSLQKKLLRILQSKEYNRLGSTNIQHNHARVIAASSGNLKELVATGSFRKETFFRLSVIEIDLPSLRERKSDCLPLAKHFLDLFSKQYKKPNLHISDEVLRAFNRYDFLGNVRELEHAIHHAVIMAEDDIIQTIHLPKSMQIDSYKSTSQEDSTFKLAKQNAVENFEKEFIVDCLRDTHGNITEAARNTGLHVTNLHSKIKKYHINPNMFKI